MEVCGAPKLALLYLLVVDSLVSEWHHKEICLGWEHASSRLQEHVPCDHIGLQHALVKEECAKGLTYDHINRLEGDLGRGNVLNLALDDLNDVLKAVCLDQGASDFSCATCLTSVDFLRSGLSSEKRQYTTAAAHIHDYFATEIGGVLDDGLTVLGRAHSVFEHILLIGQFGIVAEVLLHRGAVVGVNSTICHILLLCC